MKKLNFKGLLIFLDIVLELVGCVVLKIADAGVHWLFKWWSSGLDGGVRK